MPSSFPQLVKCSLSHQFMDFLYLTFILMTLDLDDVLSTACCSLLLRLLIVYFIGASASSFPRFVWPFFRSSLMSFSCVSCIIFPILYLCLSTFSWPSFSFIKTVFAFHSYSLHLLTTASYRDDSRVGARGTLLSCTGLSRLLSLALMWWLSLRSWSNVGASDLSAAHGQMIAFLPNIFLASAGLAGGIVAGVLCGAPTGHLSWPARTVQLCGCPGCQHHTAHLLPSVSLALTLAGELVDRCLLCFYPRPMSCASFSF